MLTQFVVTTFLYHQDGQFLLLRRSPSMRAYPGCWSAISGRIEEGATPQSQAAQEIQEETCLQALHSRTAEPFVLCVPPEKSFKIHPFCFVTQQTEPVLNPENIDFCWSDKLPEENVVPALGESLRRAKGGSRHWLSVTLREALLRWKCDQENGAVELALQSARLLASAAQEYPAETLESAVCMIRGLAIRMVAAHPDMPVIERVLGYVLRGLRLHGVKGAQDAAREREASLQTSREQAAQHAANFLYQIAQQEPHKSKHWLTLSASSTVQRTFELLSEKRIEKRGEALVGLPKEAPDGHVHDDGFVLRILESRPLGEGLLLARKLHSAGHRVALYPDMAMLPALEGCRGVLLGADAIGSDGSVRNKIGSLLLAKVAHQLGVPVYILADTWKITGEASRAGKQLPGESAILEGGVLGQSVPLFECIPGFMISRIITEEGTLDARRIEKLSERRSLWSMQPHLLWGEDFQEP